MKFTKEEGVWKKADGVFIRFVDGETGEILLSNGELLGFYNSYNESVFAYMNLCKLKASDRSIIPDAYFDVDLTTAVSHLASDRIYDITKLHSTYSTVTTCIYNEDSTALTLLQHPVIVYLDTVNRIRESIPVLRFPLRKSIKKRI